MGGVDMPADLEERDRDFDMADTSKQGILKLAILKDFARELESYKTRYNIEDDKLPDDLKKRRDVLVGESEENSKVLLNKIAAATDVDTLEALKTTYASLLPELPPELEARILFLRKEAAAKLTGGEGVASTTGEGGAGAAAKPTGVMAFFKGFLGGGASTAPAPGSQKARRLGLLGTLELARVSRQNAWQGEEG